MTVFKAFDEPGRDGAFPLLSAGVPARPARLPTHAGARTGAAMRALDIAIA